MIEYSSLTEYSNGIFPLNLLNLTVGIKLGSLTNLEVLKPNTKICADLFKNAHDLGDWHIKKPLFSLGVCSLSEAYL